MKYLFLSIILFSLSLQSQNISGIVEYKASLNYKKYQNDQMKLLEGKPEFAELIKMTLKATRDIYYKLIFDENTSYYNHIEALKTDNAKGLNRTKVLAGSGEFYTSIKSKKIQSTNSYFNGWLIEQEQMKWELLNEQKTISGYSCYKAIANRKLISSSGEENIEIIAWYTTDIPIPYGPRNYSGLPGLIIKLEESRGLIIEMTKIKETNVKVKKPEGKPISDRDFQQKIKEAREKYRDRG